jgi:ABC-2 type transport system ATP-binding protein
MIRSENLSKKYKNSSFYSVENLNLNIERGTIFGLLGPNGAGKTTTLSMLCGLLKPTSGKVIFPTMKKQNDVRKNIGVVPQELALYPKLTARENLLFFGNLYGLDKRTLSKKTTELLEIVGLEKRAGELIQNFSTGMKRRINLAIGLVHDPAVILLDEPTVGIDPQSRNCIFTAISRLKSEGKTLLYTTHYMEEASRLCDIVAIIDNGKIIMEGQPSKLIEEHGSHRLFFGFDLKPDEDIMADMRKMDGIRDIVADDYLMTVSVSNSTNNMLIIESITTLASNKKTHLSILKIEEPNLENLFLDLTGRTLRDETGE